MWQSPSAEVIWCAAIVGISGDSECDHALRKGSKRFHPGQTRQQLPQAGKSQYDSAGVERSTNKGSEMSATSLATVVQMIELLPEAIQVKVVDHLRECIEDLREEQIWDATFQRTQLQLAKAGRRARQQIGAGEATPMDLNDL